ncbi:MULTISPECIES: MarR family transcriptional regulator [Polymorphospora]|uniref:MarR family transcriptional regulator n=1 Tax=Polymorphospora lycopeni TaxID=3140240 RepID=A0ABV5CXJ8_9ACTN
MIDKARIIARIIDSQRQLQHQLAYDRSHPLFDSNLTVPQLKVLLVLSLEGSASGQDLGRIMGVSLATVTGIVDRLVGHDLVARREDPNDRRVRRIELTAAGTRLIDGIITAGIERLQRMLEQLTVDELDTIDRAATLLARAAIADAGEHGVLPA